MAQTKTQLGVKILKKTVNANLKLWGGNNVPYLRNTVDALFDIDKILDSLKVEPSVRTKIKTYQKTIGKATTDLNTQMHTIDAVKAKLVDGINSLYYMKFTINAYGTAARSSAFGPSVLYRVNESILRKLNLQNAINKTVYNNANTAVVPKQLVDAYKKQITDIKNIESKVAMELNKLAQAESKLKQTQKQLDDLIR